MIERPPEGPGVSPPRGLARWLLPSPNDIVFLVGFFAAVVLGAVLTSRDGDLGRHLRIADWMFDNKDLPLVDVFSYTAAGSPVVVHEWLAQLGFGLADRLAGFNGVGLLTAAAVSLPWAMTSRALLKRGTPVSLVTTVSVFGVLASIVHWAARPHIFTFIFFALWAITLADYEAGRRRNLFLLPLVMLIWANTHGAFIVGFVLLGMYLLAAVLDRQVARARHLIVVLAASLVASLANPSGIELLVNSFGYVGNDFLLRFTTEYNSPDFHLRGFWPFLALVLAGILFSLPRRTSARILFVGWAAFGLYSFRNIPLFALVAVPLLAEMIQEKLQQTTGSFQRLRKWLATRGAQWSDVNRQIVGGALSVLIVIVLGLVIGSQERESRFFFSDDLFPIETMDALGGNPPGDRVFNQFAWGGYLLHCCWPDIEVFIDGQTDFYGPALTKEYEDTINAKPGWNETLTKYEIDWVLIKPEMPLAQLLVTSASWQELLRDPTAVVFVRAGNP